jgi:hypothetical protein
MLFPVQRFHMNALNWYHLILIFSGAVLFLITMISLHARYSTKDPAVINRELRTFTWIALIFSLVSLVIEFYLVRGGKAPRGTALW